MKKHRKTKKALSKKDKALAKKMLARATRQMLERCALSAPGKIAPVVRTMLESFKQINRL